LRHAPGQSELSGGAQRPYHTRTREKVAAIPERAEATGSHIVRHARDVLSGDHGGYFIDPDGHYREITRAPMFQFVPDGPLIIDL
jgi:uncharacterized protein